MCELKCLKEHSGDFGLMANLEEPLDHGSHNGGIVQTVHLADRSTRRTINVGDDADHRDAVKQCFADPSECVRESWTRDHRENTDAPGRAGRGIGHHACRRLVRDQEIRNRTGLESVPQFVVLSSWNTEDAGHALTQKRSRGRLGTGHLAMNAGSPRGAAQLDTRPCLIANSRHGRHAAPTAPPATSNSRRFNLGDKFGLLPGQECGTAISRRMSCCGGARTAMPRDRLRSQGRDSS